MMLLPLLMLSAADPLEPLSSPSHLQRFSQTVGHILETPAVRVGATTAAAALFLGAGVALSLQALVSTDPASALTSPGALTVPLALSLAAFSPSLQQAVIPLMVFAGLFLPTAAQPPCSLPPQMAQAGQPYSVFLNSSTLFANPQSGALTVQQANGSALPGWLQVTPGPQGVTDRLYVGLGSGSSSGLKIFDSSNAPMLTSIANCTLPGGTNQVGGVAIVGNLLYVAGRGAGIQVLNNSGIPGPCTSVGNGFSVVQLNNSYALDAAIQGACLYVAAVGGSVRMVNISNPLNLTDAGTYPRAQLGGGAPYGVTVDGNYLYVATGSGGGVWKLDITTPCTPINETNYPLSDDAYDTAVDEAFVYIAADDIGVVVLHKANLTAVGSPYNKTQLGGRAWGVAIDTNNALLYVAVYGFGIQILNATDPANLKPVANYSLAQLGTNEILGLSLGSASTPPTTSLAGTPPSTLFNGTTYPLTVVSGSNSCTFPLTITAPVPSATLPTATPLLSPAPVMVTPTAAPITHPTGLTTGQTVAIVTTAAVTATAATGVICWKVGFSTVTGVFKKLLGIQPPEVVIQEVVKIAEPVTPPAVSSPVSDPYSDSDAETSKSSGSFSVHV